MLAITRRVAHTAQFANFDTPATTAAARGDR